jgi:citrate lyase beta subunit
MPPFRRRSLLFVPGDAERKIEKALALPVDGVILDLEDGVALNRKVAARTSVAQALKALDFGARERIVRVNTFESGLLEEEIHATVEAQPDAYLAPKVEGPQPLQTLDHLLEQAEARHGWPRRSIRLLAMIETALGIMNLREICMATPRLGALLFGAEDYAASTGATRTRAGHELLYARSAIVTAAGAYGLDAVDCVFVDYLDGEGLAQECLQARTLGFVGKTLIHPTQVDAANSAFAPTAGEIAWAQALVADFGAHQRAGKGAFTFQGKMVDMPVLRSAQRILHRAGLDE